MSAWRAGAAVLVALAAAAPARGQSTLAAGGLGLPVDAVDARTRALGGTGPGQFGSVVAPHDPASAADLRIPTLTFTGQGSWLDLEHGGVTGSNEGARFPMMGAAYPVRDWGALTLTFAGVLDQRWQLERAHTLPLGPDGAAVPVQDRFASEGGVSALQLGFAHRVSPSLALGVGVGTLTGSVTRSFRRGFDSLDVGVPVPPFETGGQWRYSGLVASAGASVDVGDVIRAGASLTWSGDLEAEPVSGSEGEARDYALPLELRGGVSARLASGLVAVVSASRADWSDTAGELVEADAAGVATALGAGVEWSGPSLFSRSMPLRLGWRRADLPFHFDGEAPTESAITAGLGLVLSSAGPIPLTSVDVSAERGSRSAGALSEDFWRSTVTLRVSGF